MIIMYNNNSIDKILTQIEECHDNFLHYVVVIYSLIVFVLLSLRNPFLSLNDEALLSLPQCLQVRVNTSKIFIFLFL